MWATCGLAAYISRIKADQANRAEHMGMPRMPGYRAKFELVQWIQENSGRETSVLCLTRSLARVGIGE
jgi:hypothetical protein